jgi:membrane protein
MDEHKTPALPRLRGKPATFFLILRESLNSFLRNDDLGAAASLAYYGLFALIPLFLLCIFVLGHYILSSQAAARELESLSNQLIPEASRLILKEVSSISSHGELWGVTGIITLLWAISPLMAAFRHIFTRIFRVVKRPALLKGKLKDATAVVALLTLFLLLVVMQIYYGLVLKMFMIKLPLLARLTNVLAPLLIMTLLVAAFFILLSPVRLRIKHLLIGGVTTALLLTVIRPLFSFMVTFNPRFGIAFGSLKAIFLILLWVYYSFSVILFGAEIIANMRKREVLLLKKLFRGHEQSDESLKSQMQKLIHSVQTDQIIISEGESGESMFYILAGSVTISKGGQTLKIMKKGEYFGEMAMLLNAPRNATAQAAEPTELVIISQDNFETLLQEEPQIVISVLKEMATRLSEVTQLL